MSVGRLDKYVEQALLPAFTQGEKRRRNAEYNRLRVREQYYRKQGNREKALELRKQRQQLPERDPLDPRYRRLRFVRYADDFCLGFAGLQEEAEEIKHHLKTFLQEQLKLELSEEKTLITHASTQPARFLGYELIVQYRDDKRDHTDRRCINGHVRLRLPRKAIDNTTTLYMQASNSHPPPYLLT